MFNAIIDLALHHRLGVLVAALAVAGVGGWLLFHAPVDVFPDLNRPTVTLITEVPGRAPEEVEQLVTFPIEAAMNGSTGVERVRSASGIGLSVVWVEFAWGTDVMRDQQIVAQRLQVVNLPEKVKPIVAPPSSIMGEIMLVGIDSADGTTSPMELRTLADWTIRPRLLAVPGVSQVTVIGGVVQQYQVLTDPHRLGLYGVSLEDLTRAVERANAATGGGFLLQQDKEALIRITGRTLSLAELADTVVAKKEGAQIRIRQVADVVLGGPAARGDSAVRFKTPTADGQVKLEGGPAVILTIQKQPGANTLTLDAAIRETLAKLQTEIAQEHSDVRFHRDIFRQADFIRRAVDNVLEALRGGIVFVALILILFLWNLRTALITLTALPLSLAVLGVLFGAAGVSLNTMTLGGIAIAVGELVDDAIVDIENIFRRLKENRQRLEPLPAIQVIREASVEVRNSIVYATAIVCVVILPLFLLSGLEGRLFAPMGAAYIVTLLASLLVSLTVTPVLSSYLLPRARFLERPREPLLVRSLKALMRPVLRFTLRHPNAVLAVAALFVALSLLTIPFMGREFLPRFNEGMLTINLQASPGTSLAESNRLGVQAERIILEVPEVLSTARRTGRAELDEHAENVNSSEIEVRLAARPSRTQAEIERDLTDRLSVFPGVAVTVGQPISHRLDHVLSGVRAQIAVKLFGPDLATLRAGAADIEDAMRSVPGVSGLRTEPLEEIDQLRIRVLHNEAARYGRTPADIAEILETALAGRVVSQVIDRQRTVDVVVWFTESARQNRQSIEEMLIETPAGRVPLKQMAEVRDAGGPMSINREGVQRRVVVSCNVAGRDLGSVAADIRRAIDAGVRLPNGYYIEYGGQFEAQQEAAWRLQLLLPLTLAGIFLLLWSAVESWQAALQILVNVPLACVGAVVALLIASPPSAAALKEAAWHQWPMVWIGAVSLSLAHMVGFITLTGIVARNGIMMISHYIHLMRHEGEQFDEAMIIRGTLERLTPVLMTAATAVAGLLPLLFGADQPGKEILHPLAVVVIGGLISSTLLDQLVTPALFLRFGRLPGRKNNISSLSHSSEQQ